MLLRVSEMDGELAAAGSRVVTWKWPDDYVIDGLYLGVRGASPGALAELSFSAYNARENREIVTDGTTVQTVSGLALGGSLADLPGRFFPVLMPVASLDPWVLRLTNAGGASVFPELLFSVTPVHER